MKKILCVILLACGICAATRADEGMWLLPMLQKMNAGAMKDLGCRLKPEQIYSINHSSLKDAIVQFGGGCTGEMISKDGLLVTNHHCGYGSIQKLSSPEHNYLEDGFWAKNRSEELPVEGLTVKFLVRMTDVTDMLSTVDNPDERETVTKRLVREAEKANPHCKALVQDFYNDNVFYLIIYKIYRDVRFVGAPPASSGKFGGDTDNWMWPRHTCDFSMFRVYAGKDNEPADYSPENKPYRPARSLTISLRGVREGDFTMIMGYPGSTQRFETAEELMEMEELHDIAIAARTIRQDIMWKAMRADEKTGLQYASKYAGSSNGWKKWIGEKKAFAKLDVIGRELRKENAFKEWVERNGKDSYKGALEEIEKYASAKLAPQKALILLMETAGRIELCSGAGRFVRAAEKADSATAVSTAAGKVSGFYKDYNSALDRDIAVAMLRHYRDNAKPEDLINLPGGKNLATVDIENYVDELFRESKFTSEEKMRTIKSLKEAQEDPANQLMDSIIRRYIKISPEIRKNGREYADATKRYTAGLLEWRAGAASYPDANSTMRLTYGSVKSYSPADGIQYKYYTTLKGVIEKEDPENYEFRVPARLKEIWEHKDFGEYAMRNGEMPACFLCNCDITGGNSGSPVLDANGNLIGLAFDGNWESMSSDVIFEPALQRCICVDIRYVLLMMDKFGGAGYLRNEMTFAR